MEIEINDVVGNNFSFTLKDIKRVCAMCGKEHALFKEDMFDVKIRPIFHTNEEHREFCLCLDCAIKHLPKLGDTNND